MNPTSAANPVAYAAQCVVLPPHDAEHEFPPGGEDARWFRKHMEPHERELRAYLRGRFPSVRDIDDLVQETYARVLRTRRVGKARPTRAYLFVIARNAAFDQLRQRKIAAIEGMAEIERLAVVEDRPDAAEAASHEQELAILAEAIATLPQRCREIFILRRYHDLSHKEIARRLQIAENTVNAQLVTAMLRCREYLRARGVTASERSHG